MADKLFFKTAEGDALRTKKLNYLVGSVADTIGPQGPAGPIGPQGNDGVVLEIIAGANVTVDNTDPTKPIVSSSGSGGGAGSGDMLKSIYDSNGNNIVDNSEKVNGLTVKTAVPLGAVFTDTTYTVQDGELSEINFTIAKDNKLSGIEANATADQTDAEIKTAYENNADTNSYTDAEKAKLSSVEVATAVDTVYLSGDGLSGNPITLSNSLQSALLFYVGTTLQEVQGAVTSDGTTISAVLEAKGGGDISYIVNGGINTIDTTPAQVITLTEGTDAVPVLNYIYINAVTNTFEKSTSGFPTATTHVPLAQVLVGSATMVQTDGAYKIHKWNDHLYEEGDNGHMSHINAWIRHQQATWDSGNALSYTGSGTTTVNVSISSGSMLQAHKHNTEAIASPAKVYVVNDENTAYLPITNIADITTDSTGSSINNKYSILTFWYVHSELAGESKLFINKASGSYSSESDARSDANKYANFSIVKDFVGSAFLVHRMIVRNSSGTLTVYDGAGDDLRGTLPNTASGSSTSISSTFLDSTFRIENTLDTTKQVAFEASGIDTATTRTITVQNQDGTMALMSDINNIGTFTEFQTNYEGEL